MKQERLFYLDVIRAICALMIVVYHFPLAISQPIDYFHSFANGSFGMIAVYSFFMVSGVALMCRYRDDENFSVRKFYEKRFFSIYPLFWITYALAFFWVFWQLREIYHVVPTSAMIWSVVGMDGWLANLVPTFYMVGEWFLGSIIMLYLAFPAVRWVYRRYPAVSLMTVFAAALILFAWHPFPIELKQNPVVDLFYFLLGAALEDGRKYIEKHRPNLQRPIWILTAAGMAVWIFVPVTKGSGTFGRELSFLIFTVIFYLFWMGAARWLKRRRSAEKIVMSLSGSSYGIFLTHHVAAQAITGHFAAVQPTAREIFMMLVMTFALTWAATRLVYWIESYIKSFL